MPRFGRSRCGGSGTAWPRRPPCPPALCQGPEASRTCGREGHSICPGVPLSSSPSLISQGKPPGNALFEQTVSPGSNRRDFDPQKVQGFSFPQSSPRSRLCLPRLLTGSQCLGVFLVLTACSSLTGAAPGGLQLPPAPCCLCCLAGNQRNIPLMPLGMRQIVARPPPLFISAYFQIFPNYFISVQSILSASGSNQAASEPQLWLQFFFFVKNQNSSFS